MMRMYKIALMGYGRWGKTLLPYLERFFDVKAIFGRSIEKKGIFTNDLDDILSSDIDAVAVATPIGTHYKIAWEALKHNKHVFCEKPFTVEPSLARELDFIATQRGLHLVTDYTYTFSRILQNARENIINKKEIGKLRTMRLRLHRKVKKNDFGVYWILASHMLAVLDMFTNIGNLEFNKTDLIPHKKGTISFMGDIRGQILVDSNSSDKKTEVGFSGDSGLMVCSNLHQRENGLTYAMEYFRGVLDGSIGNKTNIARAILVTDILWGFEKDKKIRRMQ